MQDALLRAWTRRGALAWLLWPVSLVFRFLSAMRRALYRAGVFKTHRVGGRLPVVVVVGNVVAGGAGKTPVVMALVQHWQARGLVVGVISRGYGRQTTDCREAQSGSLASEVGDEPALIRRVTGAPVFVAARRIDAARALLAAYPATQVVVSDDGLQHYALQRDIEICVFDDRGAGNGFLLPAGPLREPWPRPVDLVLHSGPHPAFAGFTSKRALADFAVRQDGTQIPLTQLQGQPLVAVAAIARPEGFFNMLRERGLTLTHTIALPDHYDFDSWMPTTDKGYTLICTEKDAVKLWHGHPAALAVPLQFAPEPAFLVVADALLDAKLSSPHTAT
ncbi:MAG: tetraacyldisaccharide 4'-kinase [Rhodoferax sp.]|nr:tetraacyldisaccharide 4'-kinase [Rhodoferax sp.]